MEEEDFSCELCQEPDHPQMIQCLRCELWFHWECVAVDQYVDEDWWFCNKCKPDTDSETSDTTSNESGYMANIEQRSNSSTSSIVSNSEENDNYLCRNRKHYCQMVVYIQGDCHMRHRVYSTHYRKIKDILTKCQQSGSIGRQAVQFTVEYLSTRHSSMPAYCPSVCRHTNNKVSAGQFEILRNPSLVIVQNVNQMNQNPEEVNLQMSQMPIRFGRMMSNFPETSQRLLQERMKQRGRERLDHRETIQQSMTRQTYCVQFPWNKISQQANVCQPASTGMLMIKFRRFYFVLNHDEVQRKSKPRHISLCVKHCELNLQDGNNASIIGPWINGNMSKKRITTIESRIFPEDWTLLRWHFYLFLHVEQWDILRMYLKWTMTQTRKQQNFILYLTTLQRFKYRIAELFSTYVNKFHRVFFSSSNLIKTSRRSNLLFHWILAKLDVQSANSLDTNPVSNQTGRSVMNGSTSQDIKLNENNADSGERLSKPLPRNC